MTKQVIPFARKQPAKCPGYAQINITIFKDGTYSIQRTGGRSPHAQEALKKAVRAMQLHIMTAARDIAP